jgi:hypothetical protein
VARTSSSMVVRGDDANRPPTDQDRIATRAATCESTDKRYSSLPVPPMVQPAT